MIFFIIVGLNLSFGQTQFDKMEIDHVLVTLNQNISSLKSGEVEYIRTLKPFNSNELYRSKITLQFNKAESNSDSFASYSISINDTITGILYDNKYYEIVPSQNTITISGLDTIKYTSIKKIVQSKGFKVLKTFIRTSNPPLLINPGFTHSEIYRLTDSSNNYSMHFTVIDSAYYDSTSYLISSTGKSLLKVTSKMYDPVDADFQLLVFDSIRFTPSNVSIKSIKDSLFRANYKILEFDPYVTKYDTTIADTIEYMPNWVAVDSNEKSFSFTDFPSKYVLLDFSYLGCYYCIESLPYLNNLYNSYQREFLSVCWLDPKDFKRKEYLTEYFKKKNIDFPIYYDLNQSITDSLNIYGYPYSFLIELPSRKIIMRILGHDIEKEKAVSEFLLNKSNER